MMQLSSKKMTHHSVMMSSSRIKILKIDKFGDFSCDINYNSRTDLFRDVISLIINQCDPRRTQSVRQPRCASKRSELVVIIHQIVKVVNFIIELFQNST